MTDRFIHSDLETNVGIVVSPRIEDTKIERTSIKLVVHCDIILSTPVKFTCDGEFSNFVLK